MMNTFLAVIGPEALWLTFVWLASAIIASAFSAAKGYGEKPGLVTGTVLTLLGAFVWAVWPAKEVSRWKIHRGLGSTEKTVLGVVVGIIVLAGVFVVVSVDAGAGGKIGLAAVVIMAAVIAAALVKAVSISRETGGKTMAELRAELERGEPTTT
jgi:amino acid transporter